MGNALTNAAAGAITSGNSTISSGSFQFTTIEGNIIINSVPRDPNPGSVIPPTQPNPPATITPSNPVTTTPPTTTPPTITTFTPFSTITQTRQILEEVEAKVGTKPTLIYVNFIPNTVLQLNQEDSFSRNEVANTSEYEEYLNLTEKKAPKTSSLPLNRQDRMELLLVPPRGESKQISVPLTRQQIEAVANEFYQEVANLGFDYIGPAEQMYDWMIAPIREELIAQKIKTLVFVMPSGLRLVPIAAMYDRNNKQFLVEQYSIGLAPSVNLIDFRYRNLKDQRVLAGGAATFEADQNQENLPAAAVEVSEITTKIRQGKGILNEDFTVNNFKKALKTNPYPIVHLATHADFQGDLQKTYVQLYDQKLPLGQLRELDFKNIDLMVISACRSAFGDENAELGFGGLAIQAGVKSALASLWYVQDIGTLALMTQFYHRLGDDAAPIKVEALRQAQIDMIEQKVRQEEDEIVSQLGNIVLPPGVIQEPTNLSHPYYWAGLTTIGSPW